MPIELAPEATDEMLKTNSRQQLLTDIVNFGNRKKLNQAKQQKAENDELKVNWWKQNYKGNKVIQDESLKREQLVQYDDEQEDDDYFEMNVQTYLK